MASMEIGARIARWRRSRGLTQRVLAQAAGVTVSAVSLWESGGSPSQSSLEAVVAVLGLTMAQFYGPLPKLTAA